MPRPLPRIAHLSGPRPTLPVARRVSPPGGKTVAFVGEAPKRVGIQEWESLEKAQAFRNSDAFKKLAPQRDKAVKTIRSYAVEAN